MKVRFVSTFYARTYGGAEISTKLLLDELQKAGVDSKIITPHYKNGHIRNEAIGLPYLSLLPKKNFILGNRILDYCYSRLITSAINSSKPDILHTHDLFALPATMQAGKKLNIPVVVTIRDNLPREYFLMSKNILEKRNSIYFECLQQCAGIIAISHHIKNKLIDFGVNHSKIRVIYNIPPNWSAENTPEHSFDEKITILAPGRLSKEKGFDVLIKAFPLVWKTNPNVQLTIIGEGPEQESLREQARQIPGNENIVFMPKLSNDSMSEYFHNSDIIAFPSIYEEPLGRIALEAGACGKPIVASRCGGIPEIVEDTVSGFLVEPGNHVELAEKLTSLVTDQNLRKTMGDHAKNHIQKICNREQIVAQTISYYEKLSASSY